ncbi:hypothetical protein DFH08DRAFT_1086958 [Mycena albidolilacea]|uniref:Uncharacterized protein n=1 Tax=Mycena albidolilacea TaxID=1033008 RepID=A0AAD6ZBJ0_9AGAR|nr:hypothetical protein DFH08DRAFT_1086958 [Mycena albidolilacea]
MGFLFFCPKEDLQTRSSSFRWPECPAYWSFDPSGVERLSMEDATCLGFPSISLSAEFYGRAWEASVYAGLRQFHQAKGFDPYSLDVARHFGEPLYHLAAETDVPFAHVDDEYLYSDEDNPDTFGMDYLYGMRSSAWEDDTETTATEEKAVLPVNVDDEGLCAEQVQDPLDIDEAESSQNFPDTHHAPESMARNEPLSPDDDEMPVSRAFKFFMNIQLALIMFLAICWLYDHVWSGTTLK